MQNPGTSLLQFSDKEVHRVLSISINEVNRLNDCPKQFIKNSVVLRLGHSIQFLRRRIWLLVKIWR